MEGFPSSLWGDSTNRETTHIIGHDTFYLGLIFGAGLALYVWLSWWLITKEKFKQPWSKIAFSFFAITGTLQFLIYYAYLQGMADTVRDFPVVTFSALTRSCPDICFLLGEDDKMFALLDIDLNDKKHVIYLPRTEVKWMTVIQYSTIYNLKKNDLMRLAEQVKNSSH